MPSAVPVTHDDTCQIIVGSQLVILPNSGPMNFVNQPEMRLKAVSDFPE
jgi:hypothetical protein